MTEPLEDAPPTVDTIVAALRSPARAEELEGEAELVEAMARVIADNHQEPQPVSTRTRPFKLGLVAGVAVLSMAGVAAAATGALPDRRPARPAATTAADPGSAVDPTSPGVLPTTTIEPSTTTPDETTPTVVEEPTTTVAPGGDPAGDAVTDQARTTTPVSAPPCPEGVANHGEYVSGVAQSTPPGPEHGQIVSAAARSSCGQDGGDEADEPDAENAEVAPTNTVRRGSPDVARPVPPGRSDDGPAARPNAGGGHGNQADHRGGNGRPGAGNGGHGPTERGASGQAKGRAPTSPPGRG